MRKLGIALLLGAACAGSACSEPAALVGLGGMCLRFDDCDPRYVCVKNVCTNNLDALVSLELVDTGSDAYVAVASDSGAPADGYTPPPADNYAPETGSAPPDATAPVESAAPPGPDANDSAAPLSEAATPGDSTLE
jgi:hypothetical protein